MKEKNSQPEVLKDDEATFGFPKGILIFSGIILLLIVILAMAIFWLQGNPL
jgi:hypothetical protein